MALFLHLSVGCAARKYFSKMNIFLCIIAAFLPDIILIPFSLMGVNGINWTHSLVMAIILSIILGLISYLFTRNIKNCIIIILLALSHWIIDFITWPLVALIPDAKNIPIFFETDSRLGLGLYRQKYIAFPIEIISLMVSVWLICKINRERTKL